VSDLFAGLIGALAGVPVLTGARCRHKHATFDEAQSGESDENVAARHAQALRLCVGDGSSSAGCPAFAECESWFLSMPPSRRPTGVVAGRVHHSRSRRQPASVHGVDQIFERGAPDLSRGRQVSLPPTKNQAERPDET